MQLRRQGGEPVGPAHTLVSVPGPGRLALLLQGRSRRPLGESKSQLEQNMMRPWGLNKMEQELPPHSWASPPVHCSWALARHRSALAAAVASHNWALVWAHTQVSWLAVHSWASAAEGHSLAWLEQPEEVGVA